MIAIRNRWTGDVIIDLRGADLRGASLREASLREADLSEADLSEADLSGADLRGASLRGASLRGASLREADLSGASLREADLRGASLREADLSGADLREASLREADLSGASLREADLSGADLSGASLREADLSEADLSGADLSEIREDLWKVLDLAKTEATGLLDALRQGRVDGSVYEGQCACLVGTIANIRACDYRGLGDLRPNARRPAERWFLAIHPGDTPAVSQVVAITVGWVEEWHAAHPAPAAS